MDFKKEMETIESMSAFFRPELGATKLLFIDNGGERYKKTFKQKDGTSKEVEQVDFTVEVISAPKGATKNPLKKPLKWSVTCGGIGSLFGQITTVGIKRGKLATTTLTLLAQKNSETGNMKYTIPESVDGMEDASASPSHISQSNFTEDEPEPQDNIGKAIQSTKGGSFEQIKAQAAEQKQNTEAEQYKKTAGYGGMCPPELR